MTMAVVSFGSLEILNQFGAYIDYFGMGPDSF
jgi:hypothetical protein